MNATEILIELSKLTELERKLGVLREGEMDRVLDALAGRSILRTDVNGWIDVSTDGTQMWVNVERKTPATPTPATETPDESTRVTPKRATPTPVTPTPGQ